MRNQTFTKRHLQRGMTITELLIATVLAVFLAGGIIQIFVGNRVTFAFNDGVSRIQENARFSLEHIAFTSRMAGYSGCIRATGVFNNLAGAANPFRDDINNGVQGFNANGTGVGQTFAATATDPAGSTNTANWTPALPPELIAAVPGGVIQGSDVLIIRGATGAIHSLVTPFSDPTQLFISGPHDFANGELLVVTDCQKASIFQLTSSAAVGTDFSLVHDTTGGFSPGNSLANWPAEQDYGLGAEVSRLQTFAFFVAPGASGRPSLFQARLQPLSATASGFQAEELAEGIDSMQIRYGTDADNDDDVDAWATADAVADWTRVLSVEVTLLARSGDEYGTELDTLVYNVGGTQFNPIDDRRLRQVFSTTVGIRNRLP
ncbi:MAG: PilW family protein [Woeseiaceae bacterium]|nr:PilW family protein [Woeseiaceae bacterium]